MNKKTTKLLTTAITIVAISIGSSIHIANAYNTKYAPTAAPTQTEKELEDDTPKYAPTAPESHTANTQGAGTDSANHNKRITSQGVQRHLDYVNKERAKAGAGPLKFGPKMNKHTAIRAKEIVQLFDHSRPNGDRSPFSDYTQTHKMGENIAIIPHTTSKVSDIAKATVQAFMDSPGHKALMLSQDMNSISIGLEKGTYTWEGKTYDATYVVYWFSTGAEKLK